MCRNRLMTPMVVPLTGDNERSLTAVVKISSVA